MTGQNPRDEGKHNHSGEKGKYILDCGRAAAEKCGLNLPGEHHYARLFRSALGKILVLKPEGFEILAATDAYLQAVKVKESELVGRPLFEAFPDNPEEQDSNQDYNLRRSLQRVVSLKTSDRMGIQRYPVRRRDGSFEARYWSIANSPILDDEGEIEFILHQVEDLTDLVLARADQQADAAGEDPDRSGPEKLTLRTLELGQLLSKVQEHDARMHTAERMLKLGSWDFNPANGSLYWSPQVFDIYDVPRDAPMPDFDSYFDLVHPDDREASRANYDDFARQHAAQLFFEHRIITRDGNTRNIRGVGERHLSSGEEFVVGFVQDITEFVGAERKLTQAEQLLELAGEKVRLGGWRVELGTESILWTEGTAAIHGCEPGYSPPDNAAAMGFYLPLYREEVSSAFDRCARKGEPFDLICQIRTVDERRLWARVIGLPERDASGRIIAVQGALQDITRLREAQVLAQEAEKRRLGVLESISDAFYALDRNWNFTYLNQQAYKLIERDPGTLEGRNVWVEFPDAAGSEIQRQYLFALENRQTTRFEEFFPPLDKWFDISAYPIPEGLAVYFRDVTGERERHQQLRLAEAALSRQDDIVIITDAQTLDAPHGPRIVYVNEAFERLTGYAKSEAIGQTPRILQGPDTDREQLDLLRAALSKREPFRCELLNYHRSGETYWLELSITPMFDDDGRCTHFVAVERDITERKQSEAELARFQERLELVSAAANDVIWDWNLASDEIWWNDSITEVFGYSIAEMGAAGMAWIDQVHPDDQERVRHSIHRAIEGETNSWSDEYRFLKKDGKSAMVANRGLLIRDDGGAAIRMVGSMRDITERREMEQKLRESQKLEAVGHLTGGVAHDFNNLLTVILGNAEMLAELAADPQQREMAELTLSAAERGAQLTSRLLAFARRQPLAPRPVDLNQLVNSMLDLIRRTLRENIELSFKAAPDLGIAEIDAGEMDTALLNLVINARDAIKDRGRLTIETANAELDSHYAERNPGVVPGEYVMICVSDTGTGMDFDTVQHAFEPFFTTKPVGEGSGLGLSMVFGFTKQSGGHIKIYSEPGEGTSIKMYFPRKQSGQQSGLETAIETRLKGGSEHILIAEDDELVLSHLESQLVSLGYRTTTARSGPEALIALQENQGIELLLTDIIMPGGMNGRELADRARELDPALRVLYTSGYTENAIVHHGRLDPGVELLSKPYTRLELSRKIRKVLDS